MGANKGLNKLFVSYIKSKSAKFQLHVATTSIKLENSRTLNFTSKALYNSWLKLERSVSFIEGVSAGNIWTGNSKMKFFTPPVSEAGAWVPNYSIVEQWKHRQKQSLKRFPSRDWKLELMPANSCWLSIHYELFLSACKLYNCPAPLTFRHVTFWSLFKLFHPAICPFLSKSSILILKIPKASSLIPEPPS